MATEAKMQVVQKTLFRVISVVTLSLGIAAASTVVYPPGTYFTLDPDGESYDGTAFPIGGTNPIPTGATLTGTFGPTAVTVGSGPVTILPTFTVSFSDSPNLVDGDFGVIDATDGTNIYPVGVLSWDVIFPGNAGQFDIENLTGPNSLAPDFPISTLVNLSNLTLTVDFGGTTTISPEPGTWLLLITGLAMLVLARAKLVFRKAIPKGTGVAKCLMGILCLIGTQSAWGQITLATETSPSSGVAGVTNVSVLGSGFPAGTITPANIIVTLSSSCDGPAVATSVGSSVRGILGSTERLNFNIPGGIITGTYYVTVADSAPGDADFTTKAGSCSALQVNGSTPILNACVAGSSMGVLLPSGGSTGNVTAYVPKGWWGGSTTGVFVKNIEGTASPVSTIPTAGVTNSCSSNPATGQTVCVANNTDVYLISGTTLNTTLHSGSNRTTGFSGGAPNNAGVALNAANNTAVINMGLAGPSGSGVQVLNLSTNTFNTAFPMVHEVSENITVDPTRSLILSANEDGVYAILQIQSDGSLKEYGSTFSSGIEDDSSAEDCSTGVAVAPGEFTNSVQLVNLNNISFGSLNYTAPNAVVTLTTAYGFAAGLSGSAVAQGSGHLAVVTGEFGGNTFAVLKLPSLPSTTTPALADYAVAAIPANAACGGGFSAGYDPHTITAYTSPNNGDAYAIFAGYTGGVPSCLAVVDMTTVINSTLTPRGGAGYQAHDIAPANLPASAVTFFPL